MRCGLALAWLANNRCVIDPNKNDAILFDPDNSGHRLYLGQIAGQISDVNTLECYARAHGVSRAAFNTIPPDRLSLVDTVSAERWAVGAIVQTGERANGERVPVPYGTFTLSIGLSAGCSELVVAHAANNSPIARRPTGDVLREYNLRDAEAMMEVVSPASRYR